MTEACSRACLLAAILALGVCGCSTEPDRRTETPPAQIPEASGLRFALAGLGGVYEWNEDAQGYVFSDKGAIEQLVGAGSDETIGDLVACLDDASPSQTTLKGQPVVVGVVCYEALRQLVYYEPTAPNGDIASGWPGHIEPTATAAELQAAKRAWQDVVGKKSYIRL